MQALTLRPHWAYAVAHLGKDIENRSWPLPAELHGQRIAIHAGAQRTKKSEIEKFLDVCAENEQFLNRKRVLEYTRGAIVATATVWDLALRTCPPELKEIAACSVWHLEEYEHHWFLENAKPLVVPYHCHGQLKFWPAPKEVESDR